MKKYSLLTFLLVTFLGFSQYEQAFKKVREATNIEGLKTLQLRFSEEQKDRVARLEKYFTDNPTKQRRWEDGEITFEIYDIIDGVEQIVRTANANSAITSRTNKLYNGGGLGLNLQGQGMKAYVWDNGAVRDTHVEFPNSKVYNVDSTTPQFHSSHVTGTLVAQGISSNPSTQSFKSRGLAFMATADCYDWTNDFSEISTLLMNPDNNLLVSNHSYTRSPSPLPTWFFGAYGNDARSFDLITNQAPYYLPVVAAGNSRNDFSNPAVNTHLSNKLGYDLIFGFQTAKNVLTVGAIDEVLNYVSNWDVNMSDFSSWGPTDDGRIKPEIVTKGVNVLSTGSSSNSHYSNANGTSMASPAITANALLLQQHYFNVNNLFMKSSTLKGLILHTADEAGPNNGPDFQFGWGLMNAEKAVTTINNHNLQSSLISEVVLNQNQIYTIQVKASGLEKLSASISWNDPAGVANSGVIDQLAPRLVNDLDLKIKRNDMTYHPWSLNASSPTEEASNNVENIRDNFERVDLSNALNNEIYTIEIKHKGSLSGGQQPFSIIITGINEVLKINNFKLNEYISIYPNPADNFIAFDSNKYNVFDVSIFNVNGIEVLELQNHELNQSIKINEFSPGIYFIKVTAEDYTKTFKLIKKY
jgi:serine protease AprX